MEEFRNIKNIKSGKLHKDNTSGFKGVSFDKHHNKWYARMTINSKSKSLGFFEQNDDAVKARLEAVQKYQIEKDLIINLNIKNPKNRKIIINVNIDNDEEYKELEEELENLINKK